MHGRHALLTVVDDHGREDSPCTWVDRDNCQRSAIRRSECPVRERRLPLPPESRVKQSSGPRSKLNVIDACNAGDGCGRAVQWSGKASDYLAAVLPNTSNDAAQLRCNDVARECFSLPWLRALAIAGAAHVEGPPSFERNRLAVGWRRGRMLAREGLSRAGEQNEEGEDNGSHAKTVWVPCNRSRISCNRRLPQSRQTLSRASGRRELAASCAG